MQPQIQKWMIRANETAPTCRTTRALVRALDSALMPQIITVLDWAGTLAFALSGGLLGVRKRFDLFGVLFLAFVAAVGGGIFRDVLIGSVPPVAITEIHYVSLAICGGLLAFYWHRDIASLQFQVAVFDAVGLGLSAVGGAEKAVEYGINPLMAALLGMISGIGGGLVRDVVSGETPFVFRGELYAVAALAGGGIVGLGYWLGVSASYTLTFGATACIFVRIMAIRYKWTVPIAPGSDEAID